MCDFHLYHRSLFSVKIGLVDLDSLKVFILVLIIEEVLRHDRVSIDLVLLDLLSLLNVLRFILQEFSRKNRLSHNRLFFDGALGFCLESDFRVMGGCRYNGGAENLSELRVVVATLRVHIVSLHILTIDSTSNGRLSVAIAIGMKSWLTEISGDR